MKGDNHSLRLQIEKWFGPAQWASLQIARAGRTLPGGTRCGCVSVSQPASARVIVFFRHDDGSWRVYPPSATRPAFGALLRVA